MFNSPSSTELKTAWVSKSKFSNFAASAPRLHIDFLADEAAMNAALPNAHVAGEQLPAAIPLDGVLQHQGAVVNDVIQDVIVPLIELAAPQPPVHNMPPYVAPAPAAVALHVLPHMLPNDIVALPATPSTLPEHGLNVHDQMLRRIGNRSVACHTWGLNPDLICGSSEVILFPTMLAVCGRYVDGDAGMVVLGPHDVRIRSTVGLQERARPFNAIEQSNAFDLVAFEDLRGFSPHRITFNAPVGNVSLPKEMFPDLMRGGSFDPKHVASAISAQIANFPRNALESIANLMNIQASKPELAGFFAKAFLMADMLSTFESNNVNGTLLAFPIGDANYFIERDYNLLILPTAPFAADAKDGVMVFWQDEWTNDDRAYLQVIANAFPRYIAPAAAVHGFPLTYVEVPGIRVRMYHGGVVPQVPNPQLTSEGMMQLLARIAGAWRCWPDFTKGFLLAAELTHGFARRTSADAVLPNIWYTATLQCRRSWWPSTTDVNWMVRVVARANPALLLPAEQTAEEMAILNATSSKRRRTIALAMGMLSVSFSTALNLFNLGGTELSAWASNTGMGQLSAAMNSGLAANCNADNGMPGLYMQAIAIMRDVYVLEPHSEFLRVGAYCGGSGVPGAVANIMWEHGWHFRIPYAMQPFCLWEVTRRPSPIWGFTPAPYEFDFRDDVIKHGDANMHCWRADMGDNTYKKIASEPYSFLYVPYGAVVANLVQQHMRHALAYGWGYRRWARSGPGNDVPFDFIVADHLDYNQAMHTFNAGSFRSYDWQNELVLAPFIRRVNLGAAWVSTFQTNCTTWEDAGVLHTVQDYGVESLGNVMQWIRRAGRGGAVATPAAVPHGMHPAGN